MSKAFKRGFVTGILDEATSSMKARRESLDAMTEQTLSVIPKAIEEKNKLEYNQKVREQKAEQFFKLNPSLGSIEMAMSFLNQFDPKNDKNVVDLSSILQQVNFDNQQKLTQVAPTAPSVTLPSTQTGGNFLDRFKDPTIADALREGEKKLGLGPGEAEAALNFVNPANRPVDPNRFELSGYGLFSPKALRDATTRNEENDLINMISREIGIGYNTQRSEFTPKTLLGNEKGGGDDLALSILNSSSDTLNHVKTTGLFTGGTPMSGEVGQNIIDYSRDVGNIGGFINQFAAYDVRGMDNTEFGQYANSYIPINPLNQDVFNKALQGKVPYGAYNSVYKRASGQDIQYKDASGNMVSITEGNKDARPDFNVAEKLLIEENKLDAARIAEVEKAQTEWDDIEKRKLDALKNVIGEQHFNDMYLGIYGTGDFNTSYDRIDDGLSSRGNYNIEENFVKKFGQDKIFDPKKVSAITIKQHRENMVSGDKIETVSDRTGGALKVSSQERRRKAVQITEKEFDDFLKKGLLPIIKRGRFENKIGYIAVKDMVLADGTKVKAGNEVAGM